MADELKGKTALVTGASRGLGRAMAVELAKAGAGVALVARDEAALRAVAAEIGDRAAVFVADVADEARVTEVEREVMERFGRVDILVNNAGMNLRKPIEEFSLTEWRTVIDVNLTSVFLMCRAFVPQMKERGWGRIINLSSIMSHIALPERTAYASAKAGLLGFIRALALELAPHGVTVVGISPGVFATELNAGMMADPKKSAAFLAQIPVGRWGRAEEVGGLVRFLCSDAAEYITGTDIVIDGGWTAQ